MLGKVLAFGLLATAVLAAGCQRRTSKADAAETAEPADTQVYPQPGMQPKMQADTLAQSQAPFTLTLSSGGGFIGQVHGWTLRSDGTVRHWRKRGAGPDTTLWETTVPADRIRGFRTRLAATGALKFSHQETGNMTAVVKLTSDGEAWTWSWPDGQPPEVFKKWHAEVEAFCLGLGREIDARRE